MEHPQTSIKKTTVAEDIWKQNAKRNMICPKCEGFLTIVQIEPLLDTENAYTPYRTIVECASCSFRMQTESFTILGSIKEFDNDELKIGSWGPSGSRVLSQYKHSLSQTTLSELQKTQELVEFLVVNKHVVQVIG